MGKPITVEELAEQVFYQVVARSKPLPGDRSRIENVAAKLKQSGLVKEQ